MKKKKEEEVLGLLALLYEYEGIVLVSFLNINPFRATFGKTREINFNILERLGQRLQFFFFWLNGNQFIEDKTEIHRRSTQGFRKT